MNTYTFLVENAEAIEQIPSVIERLERIEDHIGLSDSSVEEFIRDLEALEENLKEIKAEPPTTGPNPRYFDQDDHDELFAAGGTTERSFDPDDWAELHTVPSAADPTVSHPDI